MLLHNYPPSVYRLIYLLSFILFTSSAQAQGLFDSTNLQQVLYKDAAHAYDDDQVILLSKQLIPQLTSRLVPVQAGDAISLSTYVHYSSAPAKKTWQKIGAAAAGLAIGSLPHLLDRNKAIQEGSAGNDLFKKAAPLAGAGVASLPFVLDKRKGKAISKNTNLPESKNGLFVPNAYLSYTFYDLEGKVLSSEVRSIVKNAKDAWQQLSLHAVAPQDGYVQVEVGNSSKRPVWMEKTNLEKKSANKRREKNDNTSLLNNLIEDNYPVMTQSSSCCEWVCVYTLYHNYCYLDCPTDWYCDDWTPPDPPDDQYPGDGGGGSPPDDQYPGDGGGGSPPDDPTQMQPIDRSSAKMVGSECTAIQELYNGSYNSDGSFYKENSAWITEAGIILLPNIDNTRTKSYNDALTVQYIGGKPYVNYEGQWLEIYGHIHTQPDNAYPGTSDWNFIDDFGDDITGFIFGPNEVYRYQDDGTRTQGKKLNVYNYISCGASLSDYYY